jgi:hypothetical protein
MDQIIKVEWKYFSNIQLDFNALILKCNFFSQEKFFSLLSSGTLRPLTTTLKATYRFTSLTVIVKP